MAKVPWKGNGAQTQASTHMIGNNFHVGESPHGSHYPVAHLHQYTKFYISRGLIRETRSL